MEPWQRLDRASEADARRLLATCCGSTRWIDRMVERRPFGGADALTRVARDLWLALDPADWREAFSHHPRIGDRAALARRFAATRALSQQEQSGVTGAGDAVLDALAAGNEAYERRFGYIFIVCATGKSAEEMLALLHSRIGNDPAREIEIAAGEQAKITELRLTGLREPPASESNPSIHLS